LLGMAKWTEGLQKYGNYYKGIKKIDQVLEVHRRDTVSTFGTRSSCRVVRSRAELSKAELTNDKDSSDSQVLNNAVLADSLTTDFFHTHQIKVTLIMHLSISYPLELYVGNARDI